MDEQTTAHFNSILKNEVVLRNDGYNYLMKQTSEPVGWAYEVWDKLLELAAGGDNHQRSIAAQLLANLTKSDSDKRMLNDLETVFTVTRDEKFVTARHALQSLWKIAIVDKSLQNLVTDNLTNRFLNGMEEKNGTLVRYDIIEVFRKIYDQILDQSVKETALKLVAQEQDLKYQKKHLGLWKDLDKVKNEKQI